MAKIAVIGMGYVGIPAAVLLAAAGHQVTGLQRRSARSGWKIEWINAGRSPIGGQEPELAETLAQVVRQGRLRVTEDYSVLPDIELILIDVQTPTDGEHQPRYESLQEACRQVGRYLQPGQVVILESTVAPGTTQHLVKPLLEQQSGLQAGLPQGFGLCFSYERVMVGRLLHNIREYPKIVGGIDPLSTERACQMYRTIVRGGVYGTDPLTAEVSKTVENAYRDVQIAFANEVALLCEALGTDVYTVRQFVNGLPDDPSVPHANPVRQMHFPGAGVGGHCLPKDTWLLLHGYQTYAQQKPAYPSSVLQDARYLNDWMPLHMADLLIAGLEEAGREPRQSQVAVLGYAFVEDSDDPRNTPTLTLLRELERRGIAFRVHDPFVKEETGYQIEADLEAVLKDSDGVVLMTRHSLYRTLSPALLGSLLRTRVLIDGRNTFSPESFLETGFILKGVGKGNLNNKSKVVKGA
jgi:UDP-N-acetyl-D-mannosaminuronic acid dehydrogenase